MSPKIAALFLMLMLCVMPASGVDDALSDAARKRSPEPSPVPVTAPQPLKVEQTGTVKVEQSEPIQVTQSTQAAITTIITAFLALIGVMFNGFMAYLMAKLNRKAETVQDIADETHHTLGVVKHVHSLVNGAMHIALERTANLAQRVADITKKPEDIVIALEAAKAVSDHDAVIRAVNAGVDRRQANIASR